MTSFEPESGEVAGAQPVQQRSLALTIVAQDPAVTEEHANRILRARVRVPASHLEPGPRGARFHVVDYVAGEQELAPPVALLDQTGNVLDHLDALAVRDASILAGDPAVLAQNAYAIAARTLEL